MPLDLGRGCCTVAPALPPQTPQFPFRSNRASGVLLESGQRIRLGEDDSEVSIEFGPESEAPRARAPSDGDVKDRGRTSHLADFTVATPL